MTQQTYDVVIAGAGPTGLMLACELASLGVHVVVVERRTDRTLMGTRAGGLSARSLELLDQRGIVERFLAEGKAAQVAGFAGVLLDLSGFPTRHNYGLALRQKHIERLLADYAENVGAEIMRARDVSGFDEDQSGITVHLSSGPVRAKYLVGCDGGRSVVRKAAGIAFPGWDATMSNILAQVEMAEEPPMGVHRSPHGVYAFGREDYEIVDGEIVYAKTGTVGVMVAERDASSTAALSLEDLKRALFEACGTDFGAHDLKWISRFTDATRQAELYRKGRVLLAGDAAHIHSPIGGQGLNLGLQDAVNLGWKLAQVVRETSPDELLDSYHAERHPAGAAVLRTTMAQTAISRSDERTQALRESIAHMLELPAARDRLAAEMSGLAVRYDLGGTHPLVGRRMPDLDLKVGRRKTRVYELLREMRAILLHLAPSGVAPGIANGFSVETVHAAASGAWSLPWIGEVAPPSAVLIRPDGHVAWVGEGTSDGLLEELRRWCGKVPPP